MECLLTVHRHDEQDYVLVDTPGVRRRARVADKLERFSVLKTLQALEQVQVAVLLAESAMRSAVLKST